MASRCAEDTDEEALQGAHSAPRRAASGSADPWQRLLRRGLPVAFERHPERCRRCALHGVPAHLRWRFWQAAVGAQQCREPGRYQALAEAETPWARLIDADVPRTFPEAPGFDEAHRDSLRRVLRACAVSDDEVGYCQGMNFIAAGRKKVTTLGCTDPDAGVALLVSDRNEEETFWLLRGLLEDFRLSDFYRDGFPLLQDYIRDFAQFLASAVPEVSKHFEREGVRPQDYLHQWYMTLFVATLPLPTVLHLWDGLMCWGLKLLLPIGVTILSMLKYALLGRSFEEVLGFLRTLRLGVGGGPSGSAAIGADDAEAARMGLLLLRQSRALAIPLAQ